jgi:hypothetical protein
MTPAAYKEKMHEIKTMIEEGRDAEAVAEVFAVADTLGEEHAIAMLALIGM